MAQTLPSYLPALDVENGNLTAVVETPKGSPNKYDFDDGCAAFKLPAVLPEGSSFPYDFGLVPSAVGKDGDPLDVSAFMYAPVPVACVLTVRVIGVIEAQQRKKGEDWMRNDRLLTAATHAHTHAHVTDLHNLRPRPLDEIEAVFQNYDELTGKEFKPIDRSGPKKARKLLKEGAEAFRGNRNGGSANKAA